MTRVTIVIPVSRDLFLDRLFHSLEMLLCDREQTNILVTVDGDSRLFTKVRNKVIASKFKERLCVHRHKGIPSSGTIRKRRQRIADIHNELKGLVNDCDYVLSIEDDTIVPANTLQNLLADYSIHPFAGFISGIELGRWGFPHIGAWHINDIYNPSKIESLMLNDQDSIYAVDAAGFYCMMTKREHYVENHFEPFGKSLGPDVSYGITLRQKGLLNFADSSIRCSHLSYEMGAIKEYTLANTKPTKITLTRHDKLDEQWQVKESDV